MASTTCLTELPELGAGIERVLILESAGRDFLLLRVESGFELVFFEDVGHFNTSLWTESCDDWETRGKGMGRGMEDVKSSHSHFLEGFWWQDVTAQWKIESPARYGPHVSMDRRGSRIPAKPKSRQRP